MLAAVIALAVQDAPTFTVPLLDRNASIAAPYPPAALERGEQGQATVQLSVDAAGIVTDCAILMPSGHASLDEAACPAARLLRYHPARDPQGRPVPSLVPYQFRWVLGG